MRKNRMIGIIISIVSLIIIFICFINCEYWQLHVVKVPLHISLKEDLYSIIEVDTIHTEMIDYKRVVYLKKNTGRK